MLRTGQNTGLVRGLEKRKACDLCHIKKIRCDAKRPTCSHCVVYGSQCTYTPHIKRRRKEVQIQPNTAATTSLTLPLEPEPTRTPSTTSTGTSNSTSPGSLPPLTELLPIIHDYFDNLNCIIPLFDAGTFMRKLNETDTTNGHAPVITAAINVILALASVHRVTTAPPLPSLDPATCFQNAQSLAGGLATGNDDLLALQVLLALVMLHLGTPHETLVEARSLIANAVKLAHKLGLHQSRTNALFDAETSSQRVRAFWIVYALDRDISGRTSDPPLIRDEDHDIALPPSTEGSGLIRFTVAGSGADVYFDVSHAWIRLAHIQGRIHEMLFSVRADAQPLATKDIHRKQIHGMLHAWLTTVPTELRAAVMVRGMLSPTPAARQLTMLYFTWLACFFQTHRVGSHDAEWVTRLVDYSQRAIDGPINPEPVLGSPLSMYDEPSSGWAEVVSAARQCARLFRVVEQDDSWLTWTVTCIFVSSTLVLISNLLTVAEHERLSNADEDERLVADAVAFLGRAAAEMPDWETPQKLHAACKELSCRARIARSHFALGRLGSGSIPASMTWLEDAARQSAGYSAVALVEAFTGAGVKPAAARLWQLPRS